MTTGLTVRTTAFYAMEEQKTVCISSSNAQKEDYVGRIMICGAKFNRWFKQARMLALRFFMFYRTRCRKPQQFSRASFDHNRSKEMI